MFYLTEAVLTFYIFLSFLSLWIILNLLLECSSCLFAISHNSMSCLIHFYPSLVLLTWVCFSTHLSLLFPPSLSPSLPGSPLSLSFSLLITSFPSTSSSSKHFFQGMERHSFLSHYLNTSRGAMKFKKNKSSDQLLCLRSNCRENLILNLKPQAEAITGALWKSSEKQERGLFVARVSREFSWQILTQTFETTCLLSQCRQLSIRTAKGHTWNKTSPQIFLCYMCGRLQVETECSHQSSWWKYCNDIF